MNIKKLIPLIFVACFAMHHTSYAQDNDVVVDKVVAVVGKNIVKLSDIENSYNQIRRQQGITNAQKYRCNILESILLNKLLIHKGEVDSVDVTDERVEEQVEYYLSMYLMQFGTKEAMREATGYTYDEFHDIYFDILRDRMIAQEVEYNLTETVKMTPGQVRDYFNKIPADSIPEIEEEFEVSEICINTQISQEERERVKLELARLRERVLDGEKFSMLATLYSQDPGSAKKGGELGFFGRGKMVQEFESAAFALKPGEVSPIIETQFGFHIIQLIERRGNTINCRHILLIPKVSGSDLLATRMRLDSIAEQIRLGNITFEQAAAEFSDGDSKNLGGVVSNPNTHNNRFTRSEIKEYFAGTNIIGLEEGEISNASTYKTDEGKDAYRIMKVTKRIPAHKANLNDDYDKIYNAALTQAKNDKVHEWAQRQIKNTYIRLDEDYCDCQFELNWMKK